MPGRGQDGTRRAGQFIWWTRRAGQAIVFKTARTLVSRFMPPLQSLCHFLQTQLTGYYHLISILENQMLPPPKSSGLQNSPLTLLRLKVWTEETRVNLRLLSSVVDDERSRCPETSASPHAQRLTIPYFCLLHQTATAAHSCP